MIAITTNNSTSVKPNRQKKPEGGLGEIPVELSLQ
jgi:hypothetical protein